MVKPITASNKSWFSLFSPCIQQSTDLHNTSDDFFRKRIFCLFVPKSTLHISSAATQIPVCRSLGGCWDRTQDCCDFGIGCQTL
jgi:hypothetical protein